MQASDLISTFLAAMTPVGELRLSIPLAIAVLGMPWQAALGVSLAGNIVPPLVLVPGLDRLSRFLLSFPNPAGALLSWRTERLRRSIQAARFQRYHALALVALVAVPLPMTGAWTGALAAWVFMVPLRRAIPAIAIGLVIAGVVVTLLTLGGIELGTAISSSQE